VNTYPPLFNIPFAAKALQAGYFYEKTCIVLHEKG
jgi:hypothetical protein